MRINSALIRPGIIANAKMNSLIIKDSKLYIIKTGPGVSTQKIYSQGLLGLKTHKGALENLAVGALLKNVMKKVMAGEARITDRNLDQLAGEKDCFCFNFSELSDVSLKETHSDIELKIRAGKKKFRFDCPLMHKNELKKFTLKLQG